MTGRDMETKRRQQWMRILANAQADDLESAWEELEDRPTYKILRGPEMGLVMVQARAGGTGRRFNLGEMTITRCNLQTERGYVGHAYLVGRDFRKAELAAVFDALLQDPGYTNQIQDRIVEPLVGQQAERHAVAAAKTAATKVDFFTMVRGDD